VKGGEYNIMSMTGRVAFFTAKQPSNVLELLTGTIELIGAEEGTEYNMSKYEQCKDWENFKKLASQPPTARLYSLDGGDYLGCSSQIDYEIIRDFDFEKYTLHATVYPCRLLDEFYELSLTIPEVFRGDSVIVGVSFELGWHDLFTELEVEGGIFFGRPFYELCLDIRNYPNHFVKTREAILQLPQIKQLHKKVESFAGPIETRIFWD
jgi:hypothetical protein